MRNLLCAWLSLTALSGCGGDSSVHVCFGDVLYCNQAFDPVARAGADQTVVSGDLVTLNGSNSDGSGGSIDSYSWAQTSGPAVALTDANKARATFTAPAVTADTALTFRLTVVNGADRADTDSTLVTVQPRAAAALATALELFDGSLQPALSTSAVPSDGCASATAGLPTDQASAQLGLWLAGRSIAIAKGVDANDPSGFLDVSRVLVAEHRAPTADLAGRIESFGFALLGSLAQQRDPALHDAVAARLQGAAMLDDPAALVGGRSEVTDADSVAIEAVGDPAAATAQAITRLLASRFECVGTANALETTADGLRVIVDAAAPSE